MKRPTVTKTSTDTVVTIVIRDRDAKTIGALAKRHGLDEGELLLAALAFLVDPDKVLDSESEKDEFRAFLEVHRAGIVDFED